MVYHVRSWLFGRDLLLACCLLGVLAVAVAVYSTTQWRVRANRPEVDVVLIGRLLVVTAGYLGTALFAVLYVISFYWTLLFKVNITSQGPHFRKFLGRS